MNRVIKILEILEIFFQRGHKGLSIYSDKPINPYLEDIIEKILSTYENTEDIKILELIQKTIEIVKDDKENIREKLNAEESPLFDLDLYQQINPILISLSKDYPVQCKNNATWFLSTQEDMLSYTESIMLIREETLKFESVIEKAKLSDINSILEKIFSKINNLDFRYYKLYFTDWLLKFSDLIESEFKRIFILLNLFWKLEKKKESVLTILKEKTI